MFSELKPLLNSGGQIKLTIGLGKDGIMKVVVMPASTKGDALALSQPFAIAATPEELDAGFNEALNKYCSVRVELEQQIEATTAIISAAKDAQSKKAVKSLKGSATPAASGDSDAGDESDDDSGNDDDAAGDGVSEAPPKPKPTAVKPAEKAPAGTDLLALFGED